MLSRDLVNQKQIGRGRCQRCTERDGFRFVLEKVAGLPY